MTCSQQGLRPYFAMLLVLAKHSRVAAAAAEEMTEEVGEMTHARATYRAKTGPRSPIDRSFHKRAAKLTLFGSLI